MGETKIFPVIACMHAFMKVHGVATVHLHFLPTSLFKVFTPFLLDMPESGRVKGVRDVHSKGTAGQTEKR